jgi:ligand-binding SRPBCC domain-containing protein
LTGGRDGQHVAGDHVLTRTQTVPRPLDEVFAFFAEPANLAVITPGWLAFTMTTARPVEMRRGVRLDYRIRPLLVPQRWTSEITVWEPPHRFVDEQVRGPYSKWHHEHTFGEVDGGTRIDDRVTYGLPFGPLGKVVHALFVRRQLESIFDYRERQIKRRFG